MSSKHDGITCDACKEREFRLRRYKCLICRDYDLCGFCYDRGRVTGLHLFSHPMQCLIPTNDHGLFFSGESSSACNAKSFTCPLCGEVGFTELSFFKHIFRNHQYQKSSDPEVICPLCVAKPDNHRVHKTQLVEHLTSVHHLSSAPSDLQSYEDEAPTATSTASSGSSTTVVTVAASLAEPGAVSAIRPVTVIPSTRQSLESRSGGAGSGVGRTSQVTAVNTTTSSSSAATGNHNQDSRLSAYRTVLSMLNSRDPPLRPVTKRRIMNRLGLGQDTPPIEINGHNDSRQSARLLGRGGGQVVDANSTTITTTGFPSTPAAASSSSLSPTQPAGRQAGGQRAARASAAHCELDEYDSEEEDFDEDEDINSEEKKEEEALRHLAAEDVVSSVSLGHRSDAAEQVHRVDGATKQRSEEAAEDSVLGKADASLPTTELRPTTDSRPAREEFDAAWSYFLGELVWSTFWLSDEEQAGQPRVATPEATD